MKAADRYRTAIDIPDEPRGSAHYLGIGNPERATAGTRAAEVAKAFDDHTSVPDW